MDVYLGATSHMSREPWPCNGEGPWLSSKGRSMCVGKAVTCSHGPSSIMWSENGPCCGTVAYFLANKEGRIWFNIICLKFYHYERSMWWCLSVLGYVLESILESFWNLTWKSVMLENLLKKLWTLIHSPPCRTPCRLFIHELSFGPLGLHFLVWSELGWSLPFRPMRALTLPWSKGLQPCVWSGPQLLYRRL